MTTAFEENAVAIKYYVEYSQSEDSNVITQMGTRLSQSFQNIAGLISTFCGDGNALTQEFNKSAQYVAIIQDAVQWRKDMPKYRKQWHLHTDGLVNLIHTFYTWDLRPWFYKQLWIIESLIRSFKKKDEAAVSDCYNTLVLTNRGLAEILSTEIINQKKQYFG